MASEIYHSNGKLLITGEYLVIDGAKALAIPTRLGQNLEIKQENGNQLHWISKDCYGNSWLEATFNVPSLEIIHSSDHEKATWLQLLLRNCQKFNPNFLTSNGWHVTSNLEFERNWGLGSSSTIINCIANWAKVDAFLLHFSVSNGSGYDIACAAADQACIYEVHNQKPTVEYFNYSPKFSEFIHFVHLNQKQNSFKQVSRYNDIKQEVDLPKCINEISNLTQQIVESNHLSDFEDLILKHEFIISNILQQDTIKESVFQMYQGGIVKSLGAWGGDFVMVTGTDKDLEYFKNKGYNTILSYKEMVK